MALLHSSSLHSQGFTLSAVKPQPRTPRNVPSTSSKVIQKMIRIQHLVNSGITTILNPSSPLSRQKHLPCMDVKRAGLPQSRQAHVTAPRIVDSLHLGVSAICGLRRLIMKWVSLVVLPSQAAPANLPCQDNSGLLILFNTTTQAPQMSRPKPSQTPLSFPLHILIFANQIQIELFPFNNSFAHIPNGLPFFFRSQFT